MASPVIKIENIGKLYKLGEVGTGTISHDLHRWWARMRGKEDPFAKVGESNDRTQKGDSDYVWALRGVSFDVSPGEVVGIIGRNGAGKSTLLKILSKVTQPSEGKIKLKGRIASLLEVGTGFHPELTGRENIFLNGALLGMTKAEIRSKFDAIVDFAGVERYIDTPVKRYSSGMYVRLAFAVAGFLEPEILIVDEVLAVGDSEFQNKCLGRMKDVSEKDGRTVLFVSHNLPSLKAICQNGVLLQHGKLVGTGSIDDIIDLYARTHFKEGLITESIKYFTENIKIHSLSINGSTNNAFQFEGRELLIKVEMTLKIKTQYELDVHIKKDDFFMASYSNFVHNEPPVLEPGDYSMEYKIQLPDLVSGKYKIDLYFTQPFLTWMALSENAIEFDIYNNEMSTFLNTPSLKWGRVLLPGTVDIKTLK
ncbi:MAG: ABC transporter ATP-binding protein [Sphingobacteriales bacterium]|nr:MAG: ABC transporter ATP-binding protein [Sphingobacteriales bacterium]